jgi:Rod binding domain-containing protein
MGPGQLGASPSVALARGPEGADAAQLAKRTKEAARELEAVFLRQMLQALEKTTKVGGESSVAGQATYGSMVVDAVADSVAKSGGIGIAQLIEQSLDASLGRASK